MLLVVWAPEYSPNDTSLVFSGNCFVVGSLPLGILDIPHSTIFVVAANNYSGKLYLLFLLSSVFRNDLQVRAIQCRNCFFFLRIAALNSSDHSFCSQSHDRSIASSKTGFYRVRPSYSSFYFLYPVFPPLRTPSSFLRCLPRLLVTYILPSILPSITLVTHIRVHSPSILQTNFMAPEISSQCVFSFSSYEVHVPRVSGADFRSYSNRKKQLILCGYCRDVLALHLRAHCQRNKVVRNQCIMEVD
jgi:hypothetical protein